MRTEQVNSFQLTMSIESQLFLSFFLQVLMELLEWKVMRLAQVQELLQQCGLIMKATFGFLLDQLSLKSVVFFFFAFFFFFFFQNLRNLFEQRAPTLGHTTIFGDSMLQLAGGHG
jgi:hypothetical protein